MATPVSYDDLNNLLSAIGSQMSHHNRSGGGAEGSAYLDMMQRQIRSLMSLNPNASNYGTRMASGLGDIQGLLGSYSGIAGGPSLLGRLDMSNPTSLANMLFGGGGGLEQLRRSNARDTAINSASSADFGQVQQGLQALVDDVQSKLTNSANAAGKNFATDDEYSKQRDALADVNSKLAELSRITGDDADSVKARKRAMDNLQSSIARLGKVSGDASDEVSQLSRSAKNAAANAEAGGRRGSSPNQLLGEALAVQAKKMIMDLGVDWLQTWNSHVAEGKRAMRPGEDTYEIDRTERTNSAAIIGGAGGAFAAWAALAATGVGAPVAAVGATLTGLAFACSKYFTTKIAMDDKRRTELANIERSGRVNEDRTYASHYGSMANEQFQKSIQALSFGERQTRMQEESNRLLYGDKNRAYEAGLGEYMDEMLGGKRGNMSDLEASREILNRLRSGGAEAIGGIDSAGKAQALVRVMEILEKQGGPGSGDKNVMKDAQNIANEFLKESLSLQAQMEREKMVQPQMLQANQVVDSMQSKGLSVGVQVDVVNVNKDILTQCKIMGKILTDMHQQNRKLQSERKMTDTNSLWARVN